MSNIYEIIKRLCDGKDVTKEEQRLVEEYLKSGNDLIEHLNKHNEKWKRSGIDFCELSGDGFAIDILIFEGVEKFIKGRSLMVDEWKEQLLKIEAKLEEIKIIED